MLDAQHRALADRDSSAPLIRTAHRVGFAFAGRIERTAAAVAAISRWIVTGGRKIPLHDGENLIGRDPAAAVWLDVAGVSRRHARIVVSDGGARLEDLGSKNGTAVAQVAVTGRVELHDGDQIQIGEILIVYRCSDSGLPTETVVS